MTDTIQLLESFKDLLIKEKDALIQNKGGQIQTIVQEKERFLEALNQSEWSESEKETVSHLAREIRTLQETNLTLTKQAMKYAETFLTAIQKEAQKKSVTYSKTGSYEKAGSTGLLDQSL